MSRFLSASNVFLKKKNPNCYSVRSNKSFRSWAFREHISRALPTETILNLLRSIPLDEEFSLGTLKIIIMWLEVSVIECNGQTPQTKNLVCV